MCVTRIPNRQTANTHGKRRNPIPQQLVNKIIIKLQPLLVDRVVSPSKGDHTGPRDRKAVGLDAVVFEELDVFFPETVRVGGDVAVAAVEGAAWFAGEGVPDGGTATVGVGGAFNLEGSCVVGRGVSIYLLVELTVCSPVANPHKNSLLSLLTFADIVFWSQRGWGRRNCRGWHIIILY